MSYVRWKVERFAFNGTSWSGTGTVIADIYDPIISVAIGDKKDSFTMKLNNPYGQWDNYFQPNDKLQISRVTNTNTFDADDILMVGVIRDIPTETDGMHDEVRLEGYNFGEAISTGIVFIDTVAMNPMEIIQEAINSLALQNSNFNVTWSSLNPTTKKDGSAFPDYDKRYFYKPLSKVIEEMLSSPYTQDGSYYWWVDKDNKLQIRATTDTGTPYDYNSETDLTTVAYRDGRDTKDVKNFIILKGGLDPSNKPIQVVYRDYASINKHGVKYYFAVSKTIDAQNLNQLDVGEVAASDKYPSSYPFTTVWYASYTKTVSGISVVSGSQIEVNSDTEYREVLREEIKTQLILQAEEIINGTRFGKLKVDITTTAGAKSWQLSERVSATIPKIQTTPKLLRVVEIQKTTETDTFSLEEDVGTI